MHVTEVLEGTKAVKRVEEIATFYNMDTRKIITPRNLEKKCETTDPRHIQSY